MLFWKVRSFGDKYPVRNSRFVFVWAKGWRREGKVVLMWKGEQKKKEWRSHLMCYMRLKMTARYKKTTNLIISRN